MMTTATIMTDLIHIVRIKRYFIIFV